MSRPKHGPPLKPCGRKPPGLTLSDFYESAVVFWLAYGNEASLKPMIKHLSTVSSQLSHVERELQHVQPPPIDHQRLGEIVAKQVVVETLIPMLAPPPQRGWLSRRLWPD